MAKRLHLFPDITRAISSGYVTSVGDNEAWWPGQPFPSDAQIFQQIVFWGTRVEYEAVQAYEDAGAFLVAATLFEVEIKTRKW